MKKLANKVTFGFKKNAQNKYIATINIGDRVAEIADFNEGDNISFGYNVAIPFEWHFTKRDGGPHTLTENALGLSLAFELDTNIFTPTANTLASKEVKMLEVYEHKVLFRLCDDAWDH